MVRVPLPDLPFPRAETRSLYARFHGLRNKAKAKGVPFAWDTFVDFADDVLRVAPEGYLPSRFRMEFDKDELHAQGRGYRPDTMTIQPIKKLALEERKAAVRPTGEQPDALLVACLAHVLMTPLDGEEQDLEEVWQEAERLAA